METQTKAGISRYNQIRSRSLEICSPLKKEDYVPQPVFYVSPPKWHLAHTTWFFEQFILKSYQPGYQEFDKDYGFLFNSYYNNVGDRVLRAERGNLTRPVLEEVISYREYVDQHIAELLENENLATEVFSLLELGLNHEQQHQELLITDLKYTIGHNPLFPVYKEGGSLLNQEVKNPNSWIDFDEELTSIGFEGEGFCFDNERASHKVFINSFSIREELVSNAEYLEFLDSGGYEDFNLWLDEGWAWMQETGVRAPLHWHRIDGKWHQFSLGGLKEVDPDHILTHVNYYEANAFAAWKGLRLPTEFEWEHASAQIKWGDRWEWTQSAYLPYPGFKRVSGAVGEYNGKFMINQMVLRGASVATSPGHSRKTYRNFFHPHFQWQYSGIRLAK